ncbi:H-NS histone family protein [Fluviibacter phosphoraccumulans]|uniref:H-NS histone family protein n=1 Tax=Fluviibacter phosphoraccumulans TaxID=1751046 RepID=UPI0024E1FC1A|nr:H-NS histone family protein [Fluviibacter phosphoraccumulans]
MSSIEELKSEVAKLEEQIAELVSRKSAFELELKDAERKKAEETISKIVGELKALNLAPEDIAKALGVRVAEPEQKKVRAARGTAMPKVKGAPKYRSLTDPSLVWTGKGPRPAWIKAHLAGGGALEDLLIEK